LNSSLTPGSFFLFQFFFHVLFHTISPLHVSVILVLTSHFLSYESPVHVPWAAWQTFQTYTSTVIHVLLKYSFILLSGQDNYLLIPHTTYHTVQVFNDININLVETWKYLAVSIQLLVHSIWVMGAVFVESKENGLAVSLDNGHLTQLGTLVA
jgi:hypothetical protein